MYCGTYLVTYGYPALPKEPSPDIYMGSSKTSRTLKIPPMQIVVGSLAFVVFYDNVIAPYKGAPEEWFVSNKGLYIYFMAIFITVWAVLFPKAKIAWTVFKGLSEPPEELKLALNYKV